MGRRDLILAFGLGALVVPRAGVAALTPGTRRLGVLLFDRAESWQFLAPELRRELADLGWIEGSNLSVTWRFADDDAARLPELAAAMARSGVDAVLTRGTPATLALQQATKTIPILTGVGDPVGAGFADSLARPGGNVTGLSYAVVETSRKRLELLREIVPGLSRLAIALPASRQGFVRELTQALEVAAREFAITPQRVLIGTLDELSSALRRLTGAGRETVAAFVAGLGAEIEPTDVAKVALRARVPTMFEYRFYVEAGGLMSYRLNWENQTQRTAAQIDKVFRGASPAQIPFEFPTRSEFIINARTARALGLTIPQALVVRADEVIE